MIKIFWKDLEIVLDKKQILYIHSKNKIMDINKDHPLFDKKIKNFNKEKEILYKLLKKII